MGRVKVAKLPVSVSQSLFVVFPPMKVCQRSCLEKIRKVEKGIACVELITKHARSLSLERLNT